MKRFWSLLLVLCLLSGAACAETVAEQVNAPDHITLDTFQTDGGVSAFTINAQVQVPSVDSLNVYEYHTLPVTEEMLRKVANALGLTDMTIEPFSDVPAENKSIPYRMNFSYSEYNSLWLSAGNRFFGTQSYDSDLHFDDVAIKHKEDCGAYGGMWLWPCEGETAPDTEYPFADATELAIQTVERFAPDMTLIQSGICLSYKQLTDAEIRKLNDPNYKGEKPQTRRYSTYGYLFARVVDGVVVTYDGDSANTIPDTEELYPITYEQLALVVKDGRVASMVYETPGMAGAVKITNVKLLPFEQILAIAKQGLLQRGLMKESEFSLSTYGMISSYPIDSIVLGYMRVRTKENPNAFELIPVWDLFGQQCFEPDPNSWMRPNTLHRVSLLTINAMDGTVIDRTYGY